MNILVDYFDIIQLDGNTIINEYLKRNPNDNRMSIIRNQHNENDIDIMSVERIDYDYFNFFGIEKFDYISDSKRITDLGMDILNLLHKNAVIYLNMHDSKVSDEVKNFITILTKSSKNLHFVDIDDSEKLDFITKNGVDCLVTNKLSDLEQIIIEVTPLTLLLPIHGYNYNRTEEEGLMPYDGELFKKLKENNVSLYIASVKNNANKVCG